MLSRDLPNCPEAGAKQKRSATLIGQKKAGPSMRPCPRRPRGWLRAPGKETLPFRSDAILGEWRRSGLNSRVMGGAQ